MINRLMCCLLSAGNREAHGVEEPILTAAVYAIAEESRVTLFCCFDIRWYLA